MMTAYTPASSVLATERDDRVGPQNDHDRDNLGMPAPPPLAEVQKRVQTKLGVLPPIEIGEPLLDLFHPAAAVGIEAVCGSKRLQDRQRRRKIGATLASL